MKRNYQKELEALLTEIAACGRRPSLLIHSCCAPCSSYVLEFLTKYFNVTVYYYNPNLFPESEYSLRLSEQKRLIEELNINSENKIGMIDGTYEPDVFLDRTQGLEKEPEGGLRCRECFRLRLEAAASVARDLNYDYVTTTLSVSPHKNAQLLNELSEEIGDRYGIRFLPSDFKKNDGYKRSIELSALYGLYRQDYCGCLYSKKNREKRG